jgi:hypothetical protein
MKKDVLIKVMKIIFGISIIFGREFMELTQNTGSNITKANFDNYAGILFLFGIYYVSNKMLKQDGKN